MTRKPEYYRYIGLAITILSLLTGFVSGYSNLNSRVENLEKNKADEKAIVRVEEKLKAVDDKLIIVLDIIGGKYSIGRKYAK